MERNYVVSKDRKSGLWYAHLKGYAYVPVSGSFSMKKSEAMEYAKMCNCLPNQVKKIERRKRGEFQRFLGGD